MPAVAREARTDRRVTTRRAGDRRNGDALFRAVFDAALDAMVLADNAGRYVDVNDAAVELFGRRRDELLGRSGADFAAPDFAFDARWDQFRREQKQGGEYALLRPDGSRRIAEYRAVVDVLPGLHLSVLRDITERQSMEFERRRDQAELRELAEHDPMTGATNRRRFEQDLDVQLARCRRYHEHAVVLSIDLDGLKLINDTCGHKAGDDALKTVVGAITQRLRATDTVARVGGDEFVVLLPHTTEADGNFVASQLREAIADHPIEVATGQLPISVSVGLAVIDDQSDAELVLVQADAALYRAKEQRGGQRLGS